MTVLDNLILESGSVVGRIWKIRTKREKEVGRAALDRVGCEVSLDAVVEQLDPSERTAVALARALQGDARYLVLDEPTAVMPRAETKRLFTAIRNVTRAGVGVLYVSHHLEEIFEIADIVTILRDGRVVRTARTADLSQASLVELMLGRALGGEMPQEHSVPGQTPTAVLAVENLRSGKSINKVTLSIAPGEIVGIAGVTGSGRETLLPAIFGAVSRSGTVEVAGKHLPPLRPDLSIDRGVVMVPAERKSTAMFPDLTVHENLCSRALGVRAFGRVRRGDERHEVGNWLSQLEMTGIRPESIMNTLSGGTQQKVIIARALRLNPKILLLNEPSQGVDVGSTYEIHQLIRRVASEGTGILLASSDDKELADLCDRILVIRSGSISKELEGPNLDMDTVTRAVVGGVMTTEVSV